MTKSQYIFEQLARPGESWHDYKLSKGEGLSTCSCGHTGVRVWDICTKANMKFDTWESFGWLWERAQEKEWFRDFCQFLIKWGGECTVIRACVTYAPDHYYFSQTIIHPQRFMDAIHEFLKGREASVNGRP